MSFTFAMQRRSNASQNALRLGCVPLTSASASQVESWKALEDLESPGAQTVLASYPFGVIAIFDHELKFISLGDTEMGSRTPSSQMLDEGSPADLHTAEASAAITRPYEQALSGHESARDLHSGGRIYSQRFAPLRTESGAIFAGMSVTQDVTDVRRSETALRESEELLRLVFDHAPIGKALIGLDFRYERVNPAICQIVGYQADELCGLSVVDTTHPDDLAADLAAMAGLIAGDATSYTLEKRLLTSAGKAVWVAKSAALLRDPLGAPLRFIAQVKDISERKQQEAQLNDERRRLREAERIGRTASWTWDAASDTNVWSDSMYELYGIDPAAFDGTSAAALEMVDSSDRERLRSACSKTLTTGQPLLTRYRMTRPSDGELRWFDVRGVCRYQDERLTQLVGVVADVTEQVQAEQSLAVAHAFQQAIISASPDITFVYDVATRSTIWTNRSLADALGYTERELDEMGGDVLGRLIPDADRAAFEAALGATSEDVEGNTVTQVNHRMWHADGSVRWFSRRTCPMSRDAAGHVVQLVGALRDITDAVAAEERLEHSALHDSLTGLPNRALLVDRLDEALARSERDQREVAVLFCDLDGFKRINDTVGHAAGDAVLAETALRLRGVLREHDTVARVGGDEFVIVVEPWNRGAAAEHNGVESDRQIAVQVAERVAEALRAPIDVGGVECCVSASVGVAYGRVIGGGGIVTSDELLRDADAAMYRAKGLGKDRFEVFEHGLIAGMAERGRVEQVLRQALASTPAAVGFTRLPLQRQPGAELTAAYQPVFDSDSGRLTGFEALARLTDADGLPIAPDVFVGVAEDVGIIRQLGTRMLDLACYQLAAWRAAIPGLDHITMAINVSAIQAQHPSLVEDVRRAFRTYDLSPQDIVLELTETVLLQAAHSTIQALRFLHEEGAGIAIDDFGTGYSSLRYLAMLPVSAIKVDKSFTADLAGNSTSLKIVNAVAALAADMGLTCIVEGVETQEQRAALPAGVQLQGYLTGRPLSAGSMDLLTLLATA